ncbi:hypothetical protein ACGF5C_25950 [Micromonospora sp. NPDC047620]|uniref:hypothetical protein n=1 Tax=Micromonospora sp. NPDC047620 TaxID=3364251 RepID=UPI003717B2F8
MSAVAALALTLALAPAPTPSASGGPVGDLLGGIGQIVDDLLTGGGGASPGASPTPVPSGSTAPASPRPSAAPVAPGPSTSTTTSTRAADPARTAEGPGERKAAVPAPNGRTGTSGDASTVAAPPLDGDGEPAERWLLYGLAATAVVVPVLLVLRRRRHAVAQVGPSGAPAPTPDPAGEPLVDNVTRLPTNLNAIYELGRLDERLSQERQRRS